MTATAPLVLPLVPTTTPRPGDLGLVDIRGGNPWTRFVSASIRRLTRSRWSHAITYLGTPANLTAEHPIAVAGAALIGEAQPGGYAINTTAEYPPSDVVWLTVPTYTPGMRAMVPAAAAMCIGTPYSFLDIVALGLALAAHIPTPAWAARRLSRPDRLICSQAAVMIDHAVGGTLFDDRPAGQVSPGDLGRAAGL